MIINNKEYTEESFYDIAFSRNRDLISKDEGEILKNTTVGIVGLGGVGGIYATSLARFGFGNYYISDLDNFEIENTNRQAGASVSSAGKSKIDTIEKKILDINPFAKVKKFSGGVTEENVDEFIKGVDVVLDGIDFFNIKTRRLVYKKAREYNKFVIGAAPIGFGSSLYAVNPKGMSFDEYFDTKDGMDEKEMLIKFGLGLSPSIVPIQISYYKPSLLRFESHKAPSLVVGTLLCANMVITDVVKFILKRKKIKTIPTMTQFDPYVAKFKIKTLRRGNRSITQRFKNWYLKRNFAD